MLFHKVGNRQGSHEHIQVHCCISPHMAKDGKKLILVRSSVPQKKKKGKISHLESVSNQLSGIRKMVQGILKTKSMYFLSYNRR